MSSMTTMPPAMPVGSDSGLPPPAVVGDHRIVFRGASWEAYESLSGAQSDGGHVRLACDGRDLEIMTTGYIHEVLKELAGHSSDGPGRTPDPGAPGVAPPGRR